MKLIFVRLVDKDAGKVITVMATPGQGLERSLEIRYADSKVIGNGSFGVVFQARLIDTNEQVAIKKVLQDKRFKVSNKRLNTTVMCKVGLNKHINL